MDESKRVMYNIDEVIDILINKENDAIFFHVNNILNLFIGELIGGYTGVVVNNIVMVNTFSIIDCSDLLKDTKRLYYKSEFKNENMEHIDPNDIYDITTKYSYKGAIECLNDYDNNKHYFHNYTEGSNYNIYKTDAGIVIDKFKDGKLLNYDIDNVPYYISELTFYRRKIKTNNITLCGLSEKRVQYYLDIADTILKPSNCLRRKYGAVIVKNDEIISTGYNGTPRGVKHCNICKRAQLNIPSGQRYELCRSVHAEANAIISASRKDMIGSTLFLSGLEYLGNAIQNITCCDMCKRLIINAGIEYVVYRRKEFGKDFYSIIQVSDWKTEM